MRRQVCSGTRARYGRVGGATGAAGRLSRRRHHERDGYDGVNAQWHECRATAGDVKTTVDLLMPDSRLSMRLSVLKGVSGASGLASRDLLRRRSCCGS
jgi:hypothetical protein